MDEPQDYKAVREKALDLLRESDAKKAFAQFRGVFESGRVVENDGTFADALSVFAQIAEAVAGEEWAKSARAAAATPDDPEALYHLGYDLIEQQLHGVAAAVLERAHQLAPEVEPLLSEYVCALEGADQHAKARAVLEASPLLAGGGGSELMRYLLAFNMLMCRDLGAPRPIVRELCDSADATIRDMGASLRGMLRRADAVRGVPPLDERDLRGWHFVTTGSLLLHLSEYGAEGMNGRYAWLQDSAATCLEGIRRLVTLLPILGATPQRLLALPDRDSAILATAMARALCVPCEPWPVSGSGLPGLIVGYDLAAFEMDVLEPLAGHRPGQILWAHASCWTTEHAFAADVVTLLYQYNTSPWSGGRLRVDPETKAVTQDGPAEGSVDELAAALLAEGCDAEALADVPALLKLADAARTVTGDDAGGAFRSEGVRRRQRLDSPVKSSRFY